MKKALSAKQYVELNFPDIGKTQLVHPLAHTGINSLNYLVETDRGRYVLKKFAGSVIPAQTEAIGEILASCIGNGARVPEPVLTSRQSYGGAAGEYLLTKFYKGVSFNGTHAQVEDTAIQLAMLHKALKALEIRYEWQADAQLYKYFSVEELTTLESLASKNSDEFSRSVLSHLELLKDLYAECRRVSGHDTRSQLIHCDIQPGNLLFNGSQVSVILDFGMMRKGDIRQDVAFAAFRLALFQQDDVKGKIETFAETYSRHNRIDDLDFGQLKNWFLCHTLSRVNFILKQYYWDESGEWVQDFEKHVNLMTRTLAIV